MENSYSINSVETEINDTKKTKDIYLKLNEISLNVEGFHTIISNIELEKAAFLKIKNRDSSNLKNMAVLIKEAKATSSKIKSLMLDFIESSVKNNPGKFNLKSKLESLFTSFLPFFKAGNYSDYYNIVKEHNEKTKNDPSIGSELEKQHKKAIIDIMYLFSDKSIGNENKLLIDKENKIFLNIAVLIERIDQENKRLIKLRNRISDINKSIDKINTQLKIERSEEKIIQLNNKLEEKFSKIKKDNQSLSIDENNFIYKCKKKIQCVNDFNNTEYEENSLIIKKFHFVKQKIEEEELESTNIIEDIEISNDYNQIESLNLEEVNKRILTNITNRHRVVILNDMGNFDVKEKLLAYEFFILHERKNNITEDTLTQPEISQEKPLDMEILNIANEYYHKVLKSTGLNEEIKVLEDDISSEQNKILKLTLIHAEKRKISSLIDQWKAEQDDKISITDTAETPNTLNIDILISQVGGAIEKSLSSLAEWAKNQQSQPINNFITPSLKY